MGASDRFPVSLNAVNIVCFKINWEQRMLNVLLLKRSIVPQKNKWSLPGGFVQGDETRSARAAVHGTVFPNPVLRGYTALGQRQHVGRSLL